MLMTRARYGDAAWRVYLLGGFLVTIADFMQAPIEAHSRNLGRLTAVSGDPARRYAAHDLALLTDLAQRVGLALENTALRLALAARERELQDLVGRLLLEQDEERRRVAAVGLGTSLTRRDRGAGEQIGLRSMRERVTLLGGQFAISSKPRHGTQIFATIPLPRASQWDGRERTA
jgi:signal transduction histidine kinase